MSDDDNGYDDEVDGNEVDANTVPAATALAVADYLVRALVEDPDAVSIEVDDRGRRTTLNVTVGDGDMGRVIGRRGHVAQAIRTVTRAAASRDGIQSLDVEFID